MWAELPQGWQAQDHMLPWVPDQLLLLLLVAELPSD
jgi:hypothetical protein